MKSLRSPLILKDFAILQNEFDFIPFDEGKDIDSLMEDYIIDINFAMTDSGDGDIMFFVKIGVNRDENSKAMYGGYSIFAEGASVFSFDKKKNLSDEDKAALLQYSALSITINNVRGFISALTAFAPLGKYMLPAIDVNELLNQKREEDKKIKSEKEKE